MHLTFEINWCHLQTPKSVGVLGRSPPQPPDHGQRPRTTARCLEGTRRAWLVAQVTHLEVEWEKIKLHLTVLNYPCLWGWDTRWPKLYCSGPWGYPWGYPWYIGGEQLRILLSALPFPWESSSPLFLPSWGTPPAQGRLGQSAHIWLPVSKSSWT